MSENSESTEKKIGVLVKTSLVDYPSLLSCAFFLRNCNLRCPYCYNTGLVLPDSEENYENYTTITELFAHLEKRKNVLKGFVLSGGEPLLNKKTEEILAFAKKTGYKVKLDTNGTFPEKLEEIIKNPNTSPDYISLDLKTSPEKYYEMLLAKNNITKENTEIIKSEAAFLASKIHKSIKILSKLPSEKREFRTVMVPSLITKEDIKNLSNLIPRDSKWFFAHFQNNNCLNPEFCKIPPFSSKEEKEFLETARLKVPLSQFR